MTKEQENLVRAWKNMVKVPIIVEACIVNEVDDEALTCTVTPVTDGPEIFDVRLKASIAEIGELIISDGLVQIPTVGSTVLVALIGNDQATRFVIAFSEVEKVVFYGGLKGGLINIQTLVDELNKTNEVVQALKDSLTGWTPVPNDGGAALKTYASGQLAGKAVGDFSDMEDENVLH